MKGGIAAKVSVRDRVISELTEFAIIAAYLYVFLAALIYFKYTFFLLGNIAAALHVAGVNWQPPYWNIILPLGISFFTFQGVAYLFDVAAGEIRELARIQRVRIGEDRAKQTIETGRPGSYPP